LERQKDRLKGLDIDRQQTLTWILKKQGWRALNGFSWLKIQTSGWVFVIMEINFQVPHNEGNFLPEELASQEGLYCTEFLVIQSVSHSLTFGGTLMLTSNIWPACDESIKHRSCSIKLSHCHSLSAEFFGSFCKHSATKRPDYIDASRKVYSTGVHPCFECVHFDFRILLDKNLLLSS